MSQTCQGLFLGQLQGSTSVLLSATERTSPLHTAEAYSGIVSGCIFCIDYTAMQSSMQLVYLS
jgi:hypothetical protein